MVGLGQGGASRVCVNPVVMGWAASQGGGGGGEGKRGEEGEGGAWPGFSFDLPLPEGGVAGWGRPVRPGAHGFLF